MYRGEINGRRIAPSTHTTSAVAGFFVDEFERDGHRLALPRPEIQIVVRFGPCAASKAVLGERLSLAEVRDAEARLAVGDQDLLVL